MFSFLRQTTCSVSTTTKSSQLLGLRFYRPTGITLQYGGRSFNNNGGYNNNNNNNGGGRSFNNGGGYNNNNGGGSRQQPLSFGRMGGDSAQPQGQLPSMFDFIEKRQGGQRRNDDFSQQAKEIDWTLENLPPVSRVDYQPAETTAALSPQQCRDYFTENNITVHSSTKNIPNPILEFNDTTFPQPIISLLNNNFQKPSIIQSIGWPSALLGKDMIGVSQTGSGKTLSFFLPALMHVAAQPKTSQYYGPQVLIISPTRELSVQISTEAQPYLRAMRMRSATVFGGDSKSKQIEDLRRGPEFIVGTPGRLIDLMQDGYLSLKRVSFVVLDEADRMLEMGFEDQIRNIFSSVRPDRQVLYWTATWPRKVENLAREFIKDPIHVQVGHDELTANPNIKQNFVVCDTEADKTARLIDTLEQIFTERSDAKVLIFTMTKGGADKLADYIASNGNARIESIHGDKPQARRNNIIQNFKNNRLDILVATDVASRGLDIRTITDVINFSMPTQIESYVHRIGRTARAGASGYSHSLISKTSDNDIELLPELIDLLGRSNQPVPQEILDAAPQRRQQFNNNNRRGGGYGGRGGGYGGGRNNYNRGGNSFNNNRSGSISFKKN